MPYDSELYESLHRDLASAGVPVEWINEADSEEPPAPRDEVGLPYDWATPAVVEAVRRLLVEKGVPAGDIKVSVVIEFGIGEAWA